MGNSLSLLASSLYIGPFVSAALAKSQCVVNGKEVPCSELGKSLGIFVGMGIGVIAIIFIIGILLTIFWILMLIDCVKREVEYKPVWILVLLLTGCIGAVVYYFAVKRRAGKQSNTIPQTPLQQPPPQISTP
jgi:hypothetical protein